MYGRIVFQIQVIMRLEWTLLGSMANSHILKIILHFSKVSGGQKQDYLVPPI